MPVNKLSITDFLSLASQHPVLDVRSPGEYAHGHIPGAHSLPLFSDEERKIVGTAYKQESRERAIKIGLVYFGAKTVSLLEQVEALIAVQPGAEKDRVKNGSVGTVLLHCWRGGMRSAGVAWLLDLYGFTVYTLSGGYKAYRHWVLQQFSKDYSIHVIGGYTGSGKTLLLQQLAKQGEAVIDLESLARHKGSAFGNLEKISQPSQEMFENELAAHLSSHHNALIWMEDESQRIGLVNIPGAFLQVMRKQQLFFVNVPFEERLNHILLEYSYYRKEELEAAILRIKKRLGGLAAKNVLQHLADNEMRECFRILLTYYDKLYNKAMSEWNNSRHPVIRIELTEVDAAKNIGRFLRQQA